MRLASLGSPRKFLAYLPNYEAGEVSWRNTSDTTFMRDLYFHLVSGKYEAEEMIVKSQRYASSFF